MSLLDKSNKYTTYSTAVEHLQRFLKEYDPKIKYSLLGSTLTIRKKRGFNGIYIASYFLNQLIGEHISLLKSANIKEIYFDGETYITLREDIYLDKSIVIRSDQDIHFIGSKRPISTNVPINIYIFGLNINCRTLTIENKGIEMEQNIFTCRAIDDPFDCLIGDCEVNYI
nr:MAG TPA: hypothetical protein [Caudoviricetes sp.]